MLVLSKIEQILLDREVKFLQTEITKGFELIAKAIAKYDPKIIDSKTYFPINKKDLEELNTWVNSLKVFTTYYYGGDNIKVNTAVAVPEVLQKIILAKVAPEFVEQVDNIWYIQQELENLQR